MSVSKNIILSRSLTSALVLSVATKRDKKASRQANRFMEMPSSTSIDDVIVLDTDSPPRHRLRNVLTFPILDCPVALPRRARSKPITRAGRNEARCCKVTVIQGWRTCLSASGHAFEAKSPRRIGSDPPRMSRLIESTRRRLDRHAKDDTGRPGSPNDVARSSYGRECITSAPAPAGLHRQQPNDKQNESR